MGVLALVLGGLCFAPPTPQDVRAATRQVYEDPRWQKDLPIDGGGDPTAGGERRAGEREPRTGGGRDSTTRRRRYRPSSDREPPDLPRPNAPMTLPEGVVTVLAWAGGLTILAILGAGVVALVRSRDRRNPVETARRASAPEGGGAPAPRGRVPGLDEADALAARGRYAEAVHLLLQRAFAVLQAAGRAEAATSSLTSREVLARSRVADDVRDTLAHLVASVEVSHFGHVPIDEPEWRASRDRCVRVASAWPAESA